MPRLDRAREREIDVVAAEEEVIAHREPRERGAPVAQLRADEREVGRASADVHHEHEPAARDGPHVVRDLARARRGERRAVPARPVVKRSRRLLDERHAPEPGLAGRGEGELARDLVEGGRHGEYELLLARAARPGGAWSHASRRWAR